MAIHISFDQLKGALPKAIQSRASQEVVDKFNSIVEDDLVKQTFRDNLLGWSTILTEGRFKMTDYLNAVQYVSYKAMNCTNQEAWRRTFPENYQRLLNEGADEKRVSSYVAAYNKSKLVNLIFEQAMIPVYIANQDLFTQALNVQAELMNTAKSEKVRCDAANSVLNILKPPEKAKLEVDVTVTENSAIDELRRATQELVVKQELSIRSGQQNAQEVAHSKIIDGSSEIVDID